MKPLDSVPKLLPNFKAQPQNPLPDQPKVTLVEEEKPFVPVPLRPSSINLYKPTPKGWNTATQCNHFNPNTISIFLEFNSGLKYRDQIIFIFCSTETTKRLFVKSMIVQTIH